MKKISSIVTVAVAVMLLISNTYAATASSSSTADDSGSGSGGGAASDGGSNNVPPTRLCNGIWKPKPGMPWMWQIGTYPTQAVLTASNAQAVDLDMFGTSISTINFIHSLGKAMICYIDTQYEPGRPDSASFTAAVKGSPIDGWPGQFWVNISSPIVRNIMLERAKLALSKGCDAIEWDDVDGYSNPNGFETTYAEQIAFNTYLANLTHSLGMSVGLKNDVDQVPDLVSHYDWALNEQCYQYSECSNYQLFVKQGKAVFGTEYQGSAATFCPTQNAAGYSWLLSDLDLDGKGTTECCTYNKPACAKVAYQCVNINGTVLSNYAPADQSEGLPSAATREQTTTPLIIYTVAMFAAFFLAALF